MKRELLEVGGNGFMYVLTATQTKEVFEIVSLVLSIIISILIIISTGFKLYAWFKKASEDGKITQDEIEEGMKIVEDGKKEIEDKFKKE